MCFLVIHSARTLEGSTMHIPRSRYSFPLVAWTAFLLLFGNREAHAAAPVAPASISVTTVGDKSVSLSWASSTGANLYAVYFSTSSGFATGTSLTGCTVAAVTCTSTSTTQLANGTTYYFKVKAITSGANGGTSSLSSAQATATPFGTPTIVSTTGSSSSIAVVWTAPTGATSSSLYRCPGTTSCTSRGTPIATKTTAGTHTKDDTVPSAGSLTYYYVTATNTNAATHTSSAASGLRIAAPSGVSVTVTPTSGDSQVQVSFTAPSGTAPSEYQILRDTNASGSAAAEVGRSTTSPYVEEVEPLQGTSYYYFVKSTYANGTATATSDKSMDLAQATPFGIPTNLSVVGKTAGATVYWDKCVNCESFTLTRSPGSSSTAAWSSSGKNVAPLTNGTNYSFTMRSVNLDGISSSDTAAVTVVPYAAPTGLTVTATSSTDVTLTWTAPSPTTAVPAGYKIKRGTTSGVYTTTFDSTSTSYTDSTASAGTLYYVVSATGTTSSTSSSESSNSSPAKNVTVLAQPTGLVATAGDGAVSLAWTCATSNTGTSFKLKRSTSSSFPTESTTTFANLTGYDASGTCSYPDTASLANGTTYYYTVVATGTNSESSPATTALATPFGAVSGFSAVGRTARAEVTFTGCPGCASYFIDVTPEEGRSEQYSISETSYTIDLTDYAKYSITVIGVNPEGIWGTPSETIDVVPLSVPTGLVASGGSAEVQLDWNSVSAQSRDFDGYAPLGWTIKRSESPTGPFDETSVVGCVIEADDGPTFTDWAVEPNRTYYYVLVATRDDNYSDDTAAVQVATVLAVPTGLTASGHTGYVALEWTESLGATGYQVYRNPSPNDGSANYRQFYPALSSQVCVDGEDPQRTCSFTDTRVTNGTTYSYLLRSVEDATVSDNTAPVSATPLDPPTGLAATLSSSTAASLSWNPVLGAEGYQVDGFSSTDATEITLTGLASGQTYTFSVTATVGENSESDAVSISVTPMAPPTVEAHGHTSSVEIIWPQTTGATSYNVFRSLVADDDFASIAYLTACQLDTDGNCSHVDTTAVNGTTYYYVVTALNEWGSGDNSSPAPPQPLWPRPELLRPTPATTASFSSGRRSSMWMVHPPPTTTPSRGPPSPPLQARTIGFFSRVLRGPTTTRTPAKKLSPA